MTGPEDKGYTGVDSVARMTVMSAFHRILAARRNAEVESLNKFPIDRMQILSELSTPFVTACGKIDSAVTRDAKSKTLIYLRRARNDLLSSSGVTCGLSMLTPVEDQLTRLLLEEERCFGELAIQTGLLPAERTGDRERNGVCIQFSRRNWRSAN